MLVTAAAADDGATTPALRGPRDRPRFPRREVIWGDGKDRNDDRDAGREPSRAPFRVAVGKRPAGAAGFVKRPNRGVSERTLAWRGRDRRPSKDSEWDRESSEAGVPINAIGPLVRRRAPDEKRERAPFMDRRKAAA